ncbi:hypothetical protein [Sphingomonas colocasiae]|uniref:Tetratricopeptide repeat protein n=1 Tax=Sphingomonas colocasiae TaxID=1848973 RepID=A0ABS7PP44_9SPHN|nr:hypothetical protein [Sphingomonas colocasiae]MBY8823008.1 hypothetical protein [Sphingomonas colocasiae]
MTALLTILPALLIAAPANASEKQGAATSIRGGSVDAELADLQREVSGRQYRSAIDRLDRIVKMPLPAEQRQRMAMLQAMLFVADGDRAKGLKAIAAVRSLDPQAIEPAVIMLEFARGFRDLEITRMAMDALMEHGPTGAREIGFRDAMWVVRKLNEDNRKSEADAFVVRLEASGGASAEIATRERLKLMAARISIKAGRIDEAARAMRGVNSPGPLREALVDRIYAPIWPALEAQAGPHMRIAAAAAVEEAHTAWDGSRDPSPVVIRALAEAYFQAGRFEEADALASRFAATAQEAAAVGNEGGWVIDLHADILRVMGRVEDADKRYAAMPKLDGRETAWLVSMMINRLHMLVGDRRWTEASALQGDVERAATQHGTPYARQLVRRMKLCIAHAVKPGQDLSGMIGEITAHEKDAVGSTAEALMCVGRMDEAEAEVVRALADPDHADSAIDSLQPFASAPDHVRTIWTDGWAELGRRPTVQAALDKVGRVLPEALWPVKKATMR